MIFLNPRTINVFLLMLVLSMGSTSCDDEENETSTVRFSTTASSVNEEDGSVDIQLSTDHALSSDVQVSFEIAGSAFLNGDYSIETSSPITFEAGTQTANITLKLIDEYVIESANDEIIITLTSIGANASLSDNADDLEHTVTIEDNDNVNAEALQIDLTWDLGEGENIDLADFDLYLATNVVIDDDMVTDADIYKSSENDSGFETLWITQDDEDAEYYIVVSYIEGSADVPFTLNLNGGDGFSDENFTETFSKDDVGGALFYVPLNKSGSSISRRAGIEKRFSNFSVTGRH